MGLISNRISRENLKPGDHIYSWRTAYIYAHHGIYIGDDKVIHFTRRGQQVGTGTVLDLLVSSCVPAQSQRCPTCTANEEGHGVILTCLTCFLDGGDLYLYEYAVSTAFFLAKVRGGACTFAVSDPQDVVIHRAKSLLDKGFGCYDVYKNNCEDFALYCKTELVVDPRKVGGSGQAVSIIGAPLAAVLSTPLRLFGSSVLGMAANAVTFYFNNRYKADVGIRKDAVKVSVQDLTRRAETGFLQVIEPQIPATSARIYIGGDKVIHFTRRGRQVGTGTVLHLLVASSVPSQSQRCPTCTPNEEGRGVILTCLTCFLDGGDLYLYEYAVSPALFLAKVRGGTCTLADSDPHDVVIRRAKYLLDKGFGCYDVSNNNCEDFALYCKTELVDPRKVGRSGQVESIRGAKHAIFESTPLRLSGTNVFEMAVKAATVYCNYRYEADIGIRKNIVKVSVEDLTRPETGFVQVTEPQIPAIPAP